MIYRGYDVQIGMDAKWHIFDAKGKEVWCCDKNEDALLWIDAEKRKAHVAKNS